MKKLINVYSFVYIFIIACMFIGCDEDENIAPKTIEVNPSSISSTKEGGLSQVVVTSNTSWTVSCNANWCKINPSSGNDNQTLSVDCEANTGDTRSATITVSADGVNAPQIINVSQAGETNPFVGTWKDDAYLHNSYVQYTFNSDMTVQYFAYNGSTGTSEVAEGTYAYSESVSQVTFHLTGYQPYYMEYNFINKTTLQMGEYTYFKQ